MSPLLVVTGVGTGVGKTHLVEALLLAWGRERRVAGYKPVESGVDPLVLGEGDDAARLERASTFHVKHTERADRLRAPISPHLAAEREGRALDVGHWLTTVQELRAQAEGVVVELAGGLFSPVRPDTLNVDVLRAMRPTRALLVASDRLGALHDVLAADRAAADVPFDVLLSAPASADASTGTNAVELRRFTRRAVLGPAPRASAEELSRHPAIASLISELLVARDPS